MSALESIQQKIVLASSSPRRAEILAGAGWAFEVHVSGIDESVKLNENPAAYVKRLALAKAKAVASRIEGGLVLGADTTVVIDDQILGQPDDEADAKRMLRRLSGRWHDVLTGVALIETTNSYSLVDHRKTRVRFSAMSDTDIDWYVSTGEPKGKAGSYGVQGRAALFIEEIEGDYFNVVGLPIRLVYEMMLKMRDAETRDHH